VLETRKEATQAANQPVAKPSTRVSNPAISMEAIHPPDLIGLTLETAPTVFPNAAQLCILVL
jgi:hypothetical protein